ncbi:MAG: alpha/beta hydrolase domain-containing protein [Pseudomonadota bacterium]|uniref:alpha/beta hydrolase domain-containing protein n=1 Tax=Ralstonia pickettii TaxID=329 RepID=UPI0027152674|nr:alpha/beta hydrolase domain-containing protein [Ralstonia pickettii]MEE2976032.1 alpha/beta hydrolase domain-containing protein [Pseudomonadota bacterium]WKZ87982.1 alpha/beta hydrolase domain-containing protein [Ralstonia pickettii]
MKLPILGGALALACALAACGGNSDAGPPAPVASTAPAPAYRITVSKTEPVAGTFGNVGAYEKISGTFTGEVDPADARNGIITDLKLAPRNANGNVEYTSEFVLFKPVDMSKANGVLRYDAPNRGNIVNLDPYFASRGYVFLSSAWQGDVPESAGRVTLTVPVAKNADGSSIIGTYRAELLPTVATTASLTLPGGAFNGAMVPYAPASLDNTQPGYVLTRRINESDPRQLIPATDWKFAQCSSTVPFPGTPDPANICVKGGWDPQYLYELVYVAKDPKVMGLGLAAVRDMVSFLRSAPADAPGVANPVAGAIRYAIGSGVSQCGNFMKTFINLGFNQAADGSKVFDGVFAQIAARQTNINMRFAVPGGGGGVRADHTAFGQGGRRGLAKDYVDDVAGRQGGIMTRCDASGTCPKLFVGFSGTEFWTLQGSPMLTDAFGTKDLVQPDNARVYYYASSQHLLGAPSVPGASAAAVFGPAYNALYATNGNTGVVPVIRALYQDLEDWVVRGTQPPDNQVPRIADATLVAPAHVAFPAIPGVTYTGLVNTFHLLDWGPQYTPQDETGIATQVPPAYLGRDYAILVPQVDADGNDIAGIRSLDVAVPLATNTGWNTINRPGIVDQPGLVGSFFPLQKTAAARASANDPRLSIEERYGTQSGYVAAVTAAASSLVARRFLLQADADAAIAYATAHAVLP